MPEAVVALGDSLLTVGRMRFTAEGGRQFSAFRYDESWLAHPHRFPLSPDLPLDPLEKHASGRADPRDALHGVFADAAPDIWGRRLLTRLHGSGLSEFDYLTLADDRTRQGAIRLLDARGRPMSELEESVPRLVALDELRRLAARVEGDPEHGEEELRALAGAAASLGGARPKANVLGDDGLWIAKFTSVGDTHPVERVEVAVLKLAALCGLRAPEARLEFARTPMPVALIRRFDRQAGRRVPYMSARSALGFSGERLGSYTEIADLVREIAHEPRAELRDLYRRMLFTILVSNKDDHLKNHGFLYVGSGRWRLSPVFDVNPAPERDRRLETAIMEGKDHRASIELALEVSVFFDIEPVEAAAMARDMARMIEASWRPMLRAEGVGPAELRRYEAAFEHDELELALTGQA